MRRAVVLLVMLCAAGCDVGGLLRVDSTNHDAGAGGGPPVVLGPGTTDFVNSGTVAKNAKYRLVYTMGQATPNQAPATGPNRQLTGGVIGAAETK